MTVSQDAAGLAVFLLIAVLNFGGMLFAASLLGGRRAGSRVKNEPFECGYPVRTPTPGRLPVTFYLAGLLLLVFDVETVFLYPWAVEFRSLGVFGFGEMLVFVGLLLVGYLYLARRGAFRW